MNNRKSKKSLFTRGYKECRERLSSNSTFVRSCFNCAYYYQAVGDKTELCQNEDVLKYDMIVGNNNIYCLKWKPSTSEKTDKQKMFKKGRSRLD